MKAFVKDNMILMVIIVIGLLAAFTADIGRINVERQAKQYDIVADYQELYKMSEQSEHDISWWMKDFKGIGINKVGLSEENLLSLMEDKTKPISALMMSTILEKADWKADYPSNFVDQLEQRNYDDFDVIATVDSKELFEFINDGLNKRFHEDQFLTFATENGGYVYMNGGPTDTLYALKFKNLNSKGIGFTEQDAIIGSKLMYVNLGLLPEKVKAVEDAGMQIIPRTAGYDGWNDWKFAAAVLDGYKMLKTVPAYAVFSGEETLGYDEGTDLIIDYLNKNGIIVGLIENTTQLQNIMQAGMAEIIPATGYNAVRVFSVWDYIQNRYQYYGYPGSEEIENTLFRAIVERNIRVIYYKPMKEYKDNHTYITDPAEYHVLFSRLETRVAEHGFTIGKASVMKDYNLSLIEKLLQAYGCIAAGLLLLKTILPIGRKLKLTLFAIGAIGATGAIWIRPELSALLVSFAAAVIFASLAVVYIIKQSKQYADGTDKDEKLPGIIGKGILTLGVAVLIALLGGLMTAAPISGITHLLEIDTFRGVKASQLLPIAFFPLAYLAYYGFGKLKKVRGKLEFGDLKDMMNSSIKIWMVLLGLIGGAIGVYYILRTGHDSEIMPSTLEMIMRNTLESDLIARPRSKEFLFAFPAIMLLVYTSIRKFKIWPIVFGLSSVIGLTSVVNTFMHIRTPMYLGLARTGYSLLFGLAFGVLAILIFEGLYKLYKYFERQSALHE